MKRLIVALLIGVLTGNCSALDTLPDSIKEYAPIAQDDLQRAPWAALHAFLSTYQNPRQYVTGVYDCRHFSRELIRAAYEKRIHAELAVIEFEVRPHHALVRFLTSDAGPVYVDVTPNTDGVQRKALILLQPGEKPKVVPLEETNPQQSPPQFETVTDTILTPIIAVHVYSQGKEIPHPELIALRTKPYNESTNKVIGNRP